MSESPFRERRFSPVEVRRLVKRAAEIAARPSAGDATGSALTAREIEERAAELGIPPAALRLAVEETESPGVDSASTPGRVVVEEELDGAATNEQILDVIRDETRDTGTVEVVDGDTLTWRPTMPRSRRGSTLSLSVRIRREDGRTYVRIEDRLARAKIVGWVAVAMPIALSGGINALVHPLIAGHVALAFTLFAAVMVIAGLLGLTVSTAITKHIVRKARALGRRIHHDLGVVGPGETHAHVDATASAALRVATDDADSEEPEPSDAARREQR